MSSVPLWIQVLQALLTPAIAVAVGTIAFLQWRTAHHKVVLDLFEKRIAIYDEVIASIFEYSRNDIDPALIDRDDPLFHHSLERLGKVQSRAQFLFGLDVVKFIEGIRADLILHHYLSRKLLDGPEREEVRAQLEDIDDRLGDIADELAWACMPYMTMGSRIVRTPAQWLAERNRVRLSYSDEKQR